MDQSHHSNKNSRQKRRFNNHINNSALDIGWRDMCAPDCNGVLQNLDDPAKTCKCYFSQSGVYRNPNEDIFPPKGLPFPEFAFPEDEYIPYSEPMINNSSFQKITPLTNQSYSAWKTNNEHKPSIAFDKTNHVNQHMENNGNREVVSKAVGSSLSYFSDRSSCNQNFACGILGQLDFENSFTLFPDKSPSPSVLDGLNSYLKKDSASRTRSFSEPLSKPTVDLPAKFRISSLPNSLFESNGTEKEMDGNRMIKLDIACNALGFGGEDCFAFKTPIIAEEILPSSDGACSFPFNPESRTFQDLQSIESQCQLNTSEELGYFEKLRLEEYKREAAEIESFKKNGLGTVNQSLTFGDSPDFKSLQSMMQNNLTISCNDSISSPAAEIAKVKWADSLDSLETLNIGRKENNFSLVPYNNASQEYGKKKDPKKFNQELECKFCKSNLEKQQTYKSHNLKERIGRRTVVTCPVLRKLVCERCGATGDNAHTYSYCPIVIAETGRRPISVASELKKSKHVSSGKIRKNY